MTTTRSKKKPHEYPQVTTRQLISIICAKDSQQMEFMPYEVRAVLDVFAEAVNEQLSLGKEVYLTGLGKFTIKKTKATNKRLINTGEVVKAPPCYRMAFQPMQAKTKAMNAALRVKFEDEVEDGND